MARYQYGFVRWRGPGRTHSGAVLGVLTDVLDSDACVVALGVNDSVVVGDLLRSVLG